MSGAEVRQGPLDGLRIEGLPGPMLNAAVTFHMPTMGDAYVEATVLLARVDTPRGRHEVGHTIVALHNALRAAGVDPLEVINEASGCGGTISTVDGGRADQT